MRKATGVVRQVDDLGRIVIPKELRIHFNLKEDDPVEIYTESDDTIILKKFEITCLFCESGDFLNDFKGKKICDDCLDKLAEIERD